MPLKGDRHEQIIMIIMINQTNKKNKTKVFLECGITGYSPLKIRYDKKFAQAGDL